MAIAAALNLLVTSPSGQLQADLKKHQMSLSQFNKHVNDAMGTAFKKVTSEAVRMRDAVELAFTEGVIGAEKAAAAMGRVAEVQKYLNNGGASYNAMQAEAAALTELHTAAIDKQTAALARLDAMKGANLITPATHAAATNDLMRPAHEAGWSALERKARENDLLAAEIKNRREAGYRDQWARLERRARENDEIANAARDRRNAANSLRATHTGALFDDVNALNAKHASALETLRQAQLRLNAAKATGMLTEQAYVAEMKLANAAYREQRSILAKLGFTAKGLKGAAGIFGNSWFLGAMALGAGAKIFADFERNMDRVQVLAGATRNEIIMLTDEASRLGAVTVFSAREAAEGMTALARSGFDVADIMDAMPSTMRLAAVGMLEVKDAAEITARMMAGLQVPAQQLGDIVDMLAVASTSSMNTVEQLGEAFKFVGPVAHQAGMSIEDMVASLMVLGNSGLQGELGGTGLRNVLTHMASQSDKAADTLDRLGISFAGADGKIKPMVQILKEFNSALNGMGEMEKLRTLSDVFEMRGATSFAALLSSGPEFQEFLDELSQRAGISAKMEAALNDNLYGDFELLTSSLSKLATDAEGLGSVLRFLTNSLTFVVDTIQSMASAFGAGLTFILAGLEYVVGTILSYIPGLSSTGDYLLGRAEEMWKATERNANAARSSGAAALEAGGRAFAGAGPTESALAGMSQRKTPAGALQEELATQQQLGGEVDDYLAKRREELSIALLGEDTYQRMQLIEQARKDGVEESVRARLEEADAIAYMLAALKQAHEAQDAINDATRDWLTLGMSEGGRKAFDLGLAGTAMGDDLTEAIDWGKARKDAHDAIENARKEQGNLRNQDRVEEMGGTWSKYTEAMQSAIDRALEDHVISGVEQSELRTLQTILDQNEALEKRLDARKKDREEAKKFSDDLHKLADDLVEKFNPVKAFGNDFVKLKVALAGGLIDEATFDSALDDLEQKTLKSAGPKNIKFAAYVSKDSAEGYSASLGNVANPEFEVMKKQLMATQQSLATLKEVRRGVDRIKPEKEISFGP